MRDHGLDRAAVRIQHRVRRGRPARDAGPALLPRHGKASPTAGKDPGGARDRLESRGPYVGGCQVSQATKWALTVLVVTSLGGCYHKSQSTTGPDSPPAAVNGSPVPSPTPTPVPTPTPTPVALGCGLPPGGGSGGRGPDQVGGFTEDGNRALAEGQNEHPEPFAFHDGYPPLSLRVVNPKKD